MLVLIVDDDAAFTNLITKALITRGHDVEVMTSGFGVVNRAAGTEGRRQPDVILLDWEMAGLSGPSTLTLLAKDRRAQNVPVLMISAGHTHDHEDVIAAHSRAVFRSKDGKIKDLIEQLERHARGR